MDAELFDIVLAVLQRKRFFDRQARIAAYDKLAVRVLEQVRRRQAADVEEGAAPGIGTPGLQQKVSDKLRVEPAGYLRRETNGVERIAENQQFPGVCIKERPRSHQIAHTPDLHCL